MKKLCVLSVLMFLCGITFAQDPITRICVATANSKEVIKTTADDFIQAVEKQLKQSYPAKIKTIAVTLEAAGNTFKVTYTATFAKCDSSVADVYVKHYGSFVISTSQTAVLDAQKESSVLFSDSYPDIKAKYVNTGVFCNSTQVVHIGDSYGAVYEHFIHYGRKKT